MATDAERLTPLDSFVSKDAPICYGILKPGNNHSGGVPVVKVKNIYGGTVDESTILLTSPEIHKQYKRSELKTGDLLLTIRGSTGRVAFVPRSLEGANITQDTARIRVSTGDSAEYLYYALQSPITQRQIELNTVGQAVKGINIAEVKKLLIFHPSKPIQTKIAQILSTWDKAIATTERLLANSQQQKQALMQQLLTGQKRFAGFTEDWKHYALGQLFSERNETNRPDLSLLSITTEQGVIDRADSGKKDTSSEDKSKYRRICPGDIGYNTMRMWQGVSGLSDKEGIVSPAYTILQPTELIDSKFASYLFKTPTLIHVFMRHSQGLVSDTWNLKYEHFAKIKVFAPRVAEQQKIAQVLSTADAEIANLQAQLAALKQEKKALMQQLLTGQRRVKLDAEVEAPIRRVG